MMSPSFRRAEGIILQAIPFRDHDQIFTVFTQEAGLIKVFYKGGQRRRGGIQGIYLPLTRVELIYRERNSEIFGCEEMTLINSYHSLRQTLHHLEVACDLLRAIMETQLLGKAAPELYALLDFYLNRIPQTTDPWILAVSFRLKLLGHEGLAAFPFICSECHQCLDVAAYVCEGDYRCVDHRMPGGIFWGEKELQLLYRLATCRNYREIASCHISSALRDQVCKGQMGG